MKKIPTASKEFAKAPPVFWVQKEMSVGQMTIATAQNSNVTKALVPVRNGIAEQPGFSMQANLGFSVGS